MAYNIVFDVTDFERSLGELINKFEKRAPLMKMLAGLMSQNNIHASQGHRAALCGVWEKRMQK